MSTVTSITSGLLWTNFAFIIFGAVLLLTTLYHYVAPFRVPSDKGRDPRPRAFFSFLFATVISLFVSSILNVLYYSQQLPEGGDGISLRIHNLTVGGWATLMVFAKVSSQVTFTFLFLAIINVLQSRWYAFVQETTGSKVVPIGSGLFKKSIEVEDEKLHKFPAFLGWKGKEGASFFIAFLLVFLPLVSKLTLAIGLTTIIGDTNQLGLLNDSNYLIQLDTISRVTTFFDGVACAFIAIAVMDITASSFCLKRKMKQEGYVDSVTTTTLHLIVPLLVVLGIQTVITSSFHTIGNPSDLTLAKVDLAALVVTLFMTAFCIIVLLSLYRNPSRWSLWRPGGERVAIRMETLNGMGASPRDIDDDAASEITLTPDIVPPPRAARAERS